MTKDGCGYLADCPDHSASDLGLVIYIIIDLLVKFGVINAYNKVVQVVMGFLSRLFEPLLTPIRNIMPNLGGIDISPIILMLGLQFGFRLLVELTSGMR